MARKNKKTNMPKEESVNTEEGQLIRSLDVAEEASATVRELNNVILKLKPLVKQAKVRTIQKLVRNIHKFKKIKGSDDNVEKARMKAEKLLDEIYTIKSLPQEQIAQYALGNTVSFLHISSQIDTPVEIKGMTRVADNPKIQEYVKAFRQQHKDWDKLGDFMLFKQSGRRYKHATQTNRVERIKASEALVKTYIDKKFSGDKEKIKKADIISSRILTKNNHKFVIHPIQKTSEDNKSAKTKPDKRKLFACIMSESDDNDEFEVPKNSSKKNNFCSEQKNIIHKKDFQKNESSGDCETDSQPGETESSVSDPSDASYHGTLNIKPINTCKIYDIPSELKKASKMESLNKSSNTTDNDSTSSDSDGVDSDSQPHAKYINHRHKQGTIDKNTHNVSHKPCNQSKANKKSTLPKHLDKKNVLPKIFNRTEDCVEKSEDKDSDSDFLIKQNKEMVVRKIDWENWGKCDDVRPLIFHSNVVKKVKRKTDFFEMSGDEYEGKSSDDQQGDVKERIKPDDVKDDVLAKGYGRTLIESAFVKSLEGPGKHNKPQKVDRERTKLEIQVKREVHSKHKLKDTKKSHHTDNSKKKFMRKNREQQNKGTVKEENVHPSWAASIKRKQEQGMLSAFQGKKIKFTD